VSTRLAWEREPSLPGMSGESRVLVCHGCGAILERRVDSGPARQVGEHAPTCGVRVVDYGQRGLFCANG
jgi:hypothetical protein